MTRSLFLAALALRAAMPADLAPTAPEPARAGMDPQLLARIPARMQAYVDEGKSAGIVTMVVRHGRVAALNAVGYRDLETKAPMRTDSIFRIMSMSKPVTGVAVMMLVDEGKLALIDPVERYIPEFRGQQVKGGAKPSHPVTIYDLMIHMSGVAATAKVPRPPQTLAEAAAQVGQSPLNFDPGTQWRYSTDALNVLGRVVELVSRRPFEQFMQERIFLPLGMKDSSFFPRPETANRIATLYVLDDNGKLQKTPPRDYGPFPVPGAGMLSTAADMARLYQMVLNKGTLNGKRLLSAASVEVMTALHTGDRIAGFAPGMGYGLTWGVVREARGMFRLCSIGSYGHGGAYRTYGWVDPAKDMIRILMMHRTNGGGDQADEINSFLAMAAAAIN
jgi:CubicO group peptidase (beta-lactamase class C family)